MYLKINGVTWYIFDIDEEHLYAAPMEEHEGWSTDPEQPLNEITVFICDTCGRTSLSPDKHCTIGRAVDLAQYLVVER